MQFKNAAENFWRGKSKYLKSWLISHNFLNPNRRFYYFQGIKLFVDNYKLYANRHLNSNKEYFSNSAISNYLSFMDGSRVINKNKDLNLDSSIDNNLQEIMNVSNLDLHDYHHKKLDPENIREAHQLVNLLENTDPVNAHILFIFKAELPDGTIIDECRRFTIESYKLISRIINNNCIMLEEDLGYDLGQITTEAKLISIEIIDLDQEKIIRRRTPGFFNWLIKSNPFDLSRYQIYQKYEDRIIEFMEFIKIEDL